MAIKPTKRELHSQETRAKLVSAAEELFNEYGFDQVSVKDISEKAGVTIGALYHHFKSKDELMLQVFLGHDQTFSKMSERFSQSDDPIGDLEYFLCEYMPQRIREDGMDFTKHRVLRFYDYGLKTEFDHCLMSAVRRGIELGCYKEGLTDQMLYDLFSAIHRGAAYELCASVHEVDLAEMTRQRLKLTLGGVQS